jgi:hypothetical protein
MSAGRLWPALLASGVGEQQTTQLAQEILTSGVVGGYYIFNQPLQEVSGKLANNQPIGEGRSQAVKDGEHTSGYVYLCHQNEQY